MLMILARLVRSESFWAVVKVRSPHTVPEVCYIIRLRLLFALPALVPRVRAFSCVCGRCLFCEPCIDGDCAAAS